MKVFISWSRPTSRALAELLHAWLPLVIQTVDPYISSRDIDMGAQWRHELATQLKLANFGIVCVTPDNAHEPWLLFEAGALSNAVNDSVGDPRVVPLFLGLKPTDISGPLTAFQGAECTGEGLFSLVESLYRAAYLPHETRPLTDLQLHTVFDRLWPELESHLDAVRASAAASAQYCPPVDPRSERDMIAEVLEIVRALQRTVSPPHDAGASSALAGPAGSIDEAVAQLTPDDSVRVYTTVALSDLLKGDRTAADIIAAIPHPLRHQVVDTLRRFLAPDAPLRLPIYARASLRRLDRLYPPAD